MRKSGAYYDINIFFGNRWITEKWAEILIWMDLETEESLIDFPRKDGVSSRTGGLPQGFTRKRKGRGSGICIYFWILTVY